ncbi:MAG: hypothetical protein K2K06_04530, partial [Oscillospiraceae bacterium]|nr:hypothetical protein [Oscillospiraceae bacterium]
ERCVCELIGKGFLLSTIIVIFLLALDIDYNIFSEVNNGFKYTKYGIIILGAMMVLCWCIKIFITLGVMHKTKNLEKIADNLHTKICEQKN